MGTKLYLDIDGVINADYAHKYWNIDTIQNDFASAGQAGEFRIIWSQQMVDELFALGMDLIWTTTWRDLARQSIAPLIGYGHTAPYLTNSMFIDEYTPSIVWKLQEVLAHQKANPSKFVWIDDEIGISEMNAVKNLGGLIIATDPNVGITPEHIEKIKVYLQE